MANQSVVRIEDLEDLEDLVNFLFGVQMGHISCRYAAKKIMQLHHNAMEKANEQ